MNRRVHLVLIPIAVTAATVWFAGAAEQPSADEPAEQPAAQPPSSEPADTAKFEIPEVERPFWDGAQKFLDAYAANDAVAIGALFTTDAEIQDEFGNLTAGRDAITEMYRGVFEQTPDAQISEIRIDRVRLLTENVAVEEGEFTSIATSDAAPVTSRYFAIHVKEPDGNWRISLVRDFPNPSPERNVHLQPLEWLLGEWISEDDGATVYSNCRWSDDGNYLLRDFSVRIDGEQSMSGEQRIGWDADDRQIRSWMFDSQGGFVESVWQPEGDQWVVESAGDTSDGDRATGTTIYTVHDSEMVTWQHRDVVIGEETYEDGDPVVLTRRPPEATPSAKP